MNSHIAVLGAGNGAHAFAGDLARRGFRVRLYNKFAHEIVDLQAARGVTLEGAIEAFGPLELVTTDIEPVISGANIILIVVPANAHAFMAEACAPHLSDGQIILLNPGRTGGALEFHRILHELQVKAHVRIAEAQTLLFTCRLSGPARVRVTTIKRAVPLAAFPARDTSAALGAMQLLYTQFVAAADVLETGLDNIGAVFHPSTVILSASRIESGVPFEFYRDMTPGVVHFLEAIDAERMAVAHAYGVKAQTACEWLERSYEGIRGETLYERIKSNAAYAGIQAPRSLDVRYTLEDIPTGLVPIAALGELARLEMPASRGIIQVASALYHRDLWCEGRNAERLGLMGLDTSEIKLFIRDGPVGKNG
jgi:opine dehydrogenase